MSVDEDGHRWCDVCGLEEFDYQWTLSDGSIFCSDYCRSRRDEREGRDPGWWHRALVLGKMGT